MKRFISTALALVMLLAMASPTAMAAGTPTVSITSGQVQPGGEVTLTVSIKDNPGLAATLLYIYYDTSVFEVDPGSDLRASGSFRNDGGLIGNSIEVAKKNGRYDGDAGKDGVLALWYNGSGMNTSGDGNVMTVTLTAKNTAANGDYAVSVGYSADDTCNEKGKNVALTTGSGTVSVSGGSTTKPVTPSTPTTPTTPIQPSTPTTVVKPGSSVETVLFTDVAGHWAEEYIRQANATGLVEGYQGKYSPDDAMTRAQFVTILWRAMGSPKPAKQAAFTDLDKKNGTWYLDAVAWAEENGIVNGIGGGKFGPNGTVTREQIATILYRLAGEPVGMESLVSGIYNEQFADSRDISSWAKKALYWSVYQEIFCGESSVSVGKHLAPGKAADRAQIAVMMVRYLNNRGGNNK